MITETELVIKSQKREELESVITFIDSLDSGERKDFLSFIQGMKFAKTMNLEPA